MKVAAQCSANVSSICTWSGVKSSLPAVRQTLTTPIVVSRKRMGTQRLEPPTGRAVPRLVVPGGMDCAVLEFTRDTVPHEHRHRKLFFYDFRSAIRLNKKETTTLAGQVAEKLKLDPSHVKVLVPKQGFSEADHVHGPLFDPAMNGIFVRKLKKELNPSVEIREADYHINDAAFARLAAEMMDAMVRQS